MKQMEITVKQEMDGQISVRVAGQGHEGHEDFQVAAAIRWAIRILYHELETNGYCGGCEHVLGAPVFCALKDGPGPHAHPKGEGKNYVGQCKRDKGPQVDMKNMESLEDLPVMLALLLIPPEKLGDFMNYLQEKIDNPDLSSQQRAAAADYLKNLQELPLEELGIKLPEKKEKDWTKPKAMDSNSLSDAAKSLFGSVIDKQREERIDEIVKKLMGDKDEDTKKE